ncbi:MAG: hypothetical protein HY231_13890 [Acidobacteria bacterium]|nr:hypothetical protein [Acidobacteriota bacterium]
MPKPIEIAQHQNVLREIQNHKTAKETLRRQQAEMETKKAALQTRYNQVVKRTQEIEQSLPLLESRIRQSWDATLPEMIAMLEQRDATQAIHKACLSQLEVINQQIQLHIRTAADLMRKIADIGFAISGLEEEVKKFQELEKADMFAAPM